MRKASILTIGDELLIGQVIDTNSAWIGTQLNQIGIEVSLRIAVGDTEEDILYGLEQCMERGDLILVTGGLGPTNDDITIEVLARYFGQDLVFHDETAQHIKSIFAGRQIAFTKGHKRQCMLPEHAEILKNRLGTAPGMLFRYKGKTIVSMPGVPYEMKGLMADYILPRLKEYQGTDCIVHRTIRTAGIPESTLAQKIEDIENTLPTTIKIAYLPSVHQVRIRLTAHGTQKDEALKDLYHYQEKIVERVRDFVYGYDEDTLISVVGDLCKKYKLKLGTAESCTGGTVASMIVHEVGVSAYFKGGIVAYANALKTDILGVQTKILENHGAVSEKTVIEMVDGALDSLQVDVALAISGIAGPDGGTPEKPVGTIWVCVGNKDHKYTHCLKGSQSRTKNIQYASVYALNLLRKFLIARYNS